VHHRRPGLNVTPRRPVVAPEEQLGEPVEQVVEAVRKWRGAQQLERIRIAPSCERCQVRAERAPIVLPLLEAEDMLRVLPYAVFGRAPKKRSRSR
jgi:hypothetical protein